MASGVVASKPKDCDTSGLPCSVCAEVATCTSGDGCKVFKQYVQSMTVDVRAKNLEAFEDRQKQQADVQKQIDGYSRKVANTSRWSTDWDLPIEYRK